jgi:hypothetical protein
MSTADVVAAARQEASVAIAERLVKALLIVAEIWGLQGLGGGVIGLKLETHHPVIEPVSTRAGNGNF